MVKVVHRVVDPAQLQGNVLRGYRRLRNRAVVLEVANAPKARKWLGDAVSREPTDVPTITSEEPWDALPKTTFNLGISFEGLKALGLPDDSLASFPPEFVEGMEARALKLGDAGSSAPSTWYEPFRDQSRVHIVVSLYGDQTAHLDETEARIASGGGGEAFRVLGSIDGSRANQDIVHFGYRDSISQPRFQGIHDAADLQDAQPLVPLGTVLLGHPTAFEELSWRVPHPEPLGMLGTFDALRILQQDVGAFEAFLTRSAETLLAGDHADEFLVEGWETLWDGDHTRETAMREVVAARLCGRWRNGTPLQLSPDTPTPKGGVSDTDFDYDEGTRCPYGAHTRRSNPRGSRIVQRVANHTRRLVRRGMPYGPDWKADEPEGTTRGLVGHFLCANLGAQFEAVMCDWVNLGLQDPRIAGTNDPLLGVNDASISAFEIPLKDGGSVRLDGLPRLVDTKGGAYLFVPSLPAIRHIAELPQYTR